MAYWPTWIVCACDVPAAPERPGFPPIRASWRTYIEYSSCGFGDARNRRVHVAGASGRARSSSDNCRRARPSPSSRTRRATGEWRSPGLRTIVQAKPARVEVFRNEHDIRRLASGYGTVRKTATGVEARADIADDGRVLFRVDDQWSIDGAVLSVKRRVEVVRNAPGGFSSTVAFDRRSRPWAGTM